MDQTQILMEERKCKYVMCLKPFHVLESSPMEYCCLPHKELSEGKQKVFRNGDRRADGRIWEGGGWRTPEQIADRKKQHNSWAKQAEVKKKEMRLESCDTRKLSENDDYDRGLGLSDLLNTEKRRTLEDNVTDVTTQTTLESKESTTMQTTATQAFLPPKKRSLAPGSPIRPWGNIFDKNH